MNPGLTYRTVRHLKPIQVWFQVWRRIQKRLEPHPRAKCANGALPEFTFLNTTARPNGWNDESLELLWRYNLHYFNGMGASASGNAMSDDGGAMDWAALAERWIEENPRGSFPGWEPYPTSIRIVNWAKWLKGGGLKDRMGDGDVGERAKCTEAHVMESLRMQTDWLAGHLEYHLLANHLLANAKALVFAGKCLDRKDWYERGMSIYRRQLPEQTCDDGVNFELSPMYHAVIFEDLLDLAECTDEGLFWEYAVKMAAGMRILTGPDGRIAKFNDSAEGIAKQPADLLDRFESLARHRGRTEEVDLAASPRRPGLSSGFVRKQSGDWTLLAKCGDIGPSYQPGHAHADTHSFELWKAGRKVVGDTGCSTYVPGPIRSHERSTKAHNTVMVDGRDSSEVWASHRVGRRFDAKSHRREFELTANGLKGVDFLGGRGEHDVEVRFHLPPGVSKDEIDIACPGELEWERCEFAEGWNVRKTGLCAVYSLRRAFPTRIEWEIK